MTPCTVSVQNIPHPFKCLGDTRVLYHNIAVVVPPTHIVRSVIQYAHSQFGYMKQI